MQVIEYIQAAAEVKASEIVSAFPAERSNWEDFRQELMIHACRQIDRHDPGRGKIKTFVSAVVENKKKSILRRLQKNRGGLKKQYGGGIAWEEAAGDSAGACSIEHIVEARHVAVARMISEGYTRAEISRALKISAWKIRRMLQEMKSGRG